MTLSLKLILRNDRPQNERQSVRDEEVIRTMAISGQSLSCLSSENGGTDYVSNLMVTHLSCNGEVHGHLLEVA